MDKESLTLEEFNENLDKLIKKAEYRKFNKEFKKIKKQLKKDAKEFQPWDYDYLLRFVEHSLEAMSLFLCNKHLIMQDTEWFDSSDPDNNWENHTAKLKECYELIKNRSNTGDPMNENRNIEKALKIMSKYIFTWWD